MNSQDIGPAMRYALSKIAEPRVPVARDREDLALQIEAAYRAMWQLNAGPHAKPTKWRKS